jgi:hypothetical protein
MSWHTAIAQFGNALILIALDQRTNDLHRGGRGHASQVDRLAVLYVPFLTIVLEVSLLALQSPGNATKR